MKNILATCMFLFGLTVSTGAYAQFELFVYDFQGSFRAEIHLKNKKVFKFRKKRTKKSGHHVTLYDLSAKDIKKVIFYPSGRFPKTVRVKSNWTNAWYRGKKKK